MRPGQEQLDAPLAAALCEAISGGTGSPANIDSLTEITGGSISRALCWQARANATSSN
jgi:hypothetical protein